jgi:hypothetical protein
LGVDLSIRTRWNNRRGCQLQIWRRMSG